MTDAELKAIAERNERRKALKAAASAGPWEAQDNGEIHGLANEHGYRERVFEAVSWSVNDRCETDQRINASAEDLDFITTARSDPVEADVDALLAERARILALVEDRYGIPEWVVEKALQEG